MAAVWVLSAVALLFLAALLLRQVSGSWWAPGPLFCLYWAGAIAVPPLLAPGYVQSGAAVRYIVLLVLSVGVGALVASPRRPPVREADVEPRPLHLPTMRWLVVLGSAAGVAAAVVIQLANGYSIGSILSLRGLFTAASSIADDRYTGALAVPVAVPLLLGLSYAAALLSPFAAHGLGKGRGTLVILGPIVGAVAYALVTTARAGMLTAIFFSVAGGIASAMYWRGEMPRVRARSALAAAAAAAAMTTLFVGIALLRTGSADSRTLQLVLDRVSVYVAGYMPGFSHWYETSADTFPSSWGSATFAGVAQYVGGDEKYGQALTDWAPLGDGGDTNIYTGWRYLIEDGGLVLAPLAAALLGLLLTLAWQHLVQRPSMPALMGCLAGYAYLLHSVTLSIFTFTNVLVAFLLAWLALARRVAPREVDAARASHRTGTVPVVPLFRSRA